MSPAPLPGPPEDHTLLVEFPLLEEERLPDVLFRVHRLDHEPQWFASTGILEAEVAELLAGKQPAAVEAGT